MASITLLDNDRQWRKSQIGLTTEAPREKAFCDFTVRQDAALIVGDASTDERCVCYLATSLTRTDCEPDPTEALTLERVPFMEALAAVTSDRIVDAMTVATVLRVHHMAVTGELDPALARAALGHSTTSGL